MNSAIIALLVITVWGMSRGRILYEGVGVFIRNGLQLAFGGEAQHAHTKRRRTRRPRRQEGIKPIATTTRGM